MLQDAGWVEGRDWQNEVELHGMPSKSGEGRADYVLYGDDGRPLAVLEAKSSCTDVTKGRQQAEKYADCLEKQYGRRPIIFLSNGFETRIWNDKYSPERKVAAVYSKRDLEKLYNLQTMRTSLRNVVVNKNIAGRYYQEGAIKAVCESLDAKNRREALLVMATGSGKTRTVIALCDVLLQHGWVKNILFLADRNSLVTQAKRAFVNMLPDLSVTNLCEDKENYDARCVFSTYQTMMNCIDAVRDENDRKLYTVGHFDLVIVDEAHRSIYNKYRDIFTYETIDRDIEQFVQTQCSSTNVFDWIHTIFYCVNVDSRRVEPAEIDFIKRLSGKTSQTIHIIITHCEQTSEGIDKSTAMKQYILSQLENKNVRVYCVNSTPTITRVGTHEAFGREEVLDQIFILLWSDIANKIACDYAAELRKELVRMHSTVESACNAAVEQLGATAILADAINDREDTLSSVERAFDNCKGKLEKIEEQLKESYGKKTEPLIKFCDDYGKSLGHNIELCNPFEFISDGEFVDIDFDGILDHSRIARELEEVENINFNTVGGMFKGIFKTAGLLLRMKSLFKELFDSCCIELWYRLPGESKIKDSVYAALMKGLPEQP